MFKKKEKGTEPEVVAESTASSTPAEETTKVEEPSDTPTAEVESEPEVEVKVEAEAKPKEEKKNTSPAPAKPKQPEDKKVEVTGPPLGKLLTGNFKVYRGRNIQTITALTNAVIVDGDYIEENGLLWLPVRFNNKIGTESKGFIFQPKE